MLNLNLDIKLRKLFKKGSLSDDEFEFICEHEQVKRIEYAPDDDEFETGKEKYWVETFDGAEYFIYKDFYCVLFY